MDSGQGSHISRRSILAAAGLSIGCWSRLFAADDFWNKKPADKWSEDEIDRLLTRSPWAKEVAARIDAEREGRPGGATGGDPGGVGMPRIGGIGGIGGMGGPRIGGMGGGRGRGGREGGPQASGFRGVVRWQSAKPLLDALKTPLPEVFAGHYVLSVTGLPITSGHRRRQADEESDSMQDMLDRLKGLTSLEPKGRSGAQPGIVEQQPTTGGASVLFGFSEELLALSTGDREAKFSTRLGELAVSAKFNLKDMMYHGELAL